MLLISMGERTGSLYQSFLLVIVMCTMMILIILKDKAQATNAILMVFKGDIYKAMYVTQAAIQ